MLAAARNADEDASGARWRALMQATGVSHVVTGPNSSSVVLAAIKDMHAMPVPAVREVTFVGDPRPRPGCPVNAIPTFVVPRVIRSGPSVDNRRALLKKLIFIASIAVLLLAGRMSWTHRAPGPDQLPGTALLQSALKAPAAPGVDF
ncbi:hypothetical protein ACU4GD_15855 [Cupriavidus basilensis]